MVTCQEGWWQLRLEGTAVSQTVLEHAGIALALRSLHLVLC